MTDPTTPIPSDAGIVATAGIEPQNIVVQAIEGAKSQLVAYLGRPDVEKELAQGIFAYVNGQWPVIADNPIALGVEKFILNLIASRSAPTP